MFLKLRKYFSVRFDAFAVYFSVTKLLLNCLSIASNKINESLVYRQLQISQAFSQVCLQLFRKHIATFETAVVKVGMSPAIYMP